MSKETVSIVWFRRDLRLCDNPALAAACANGGVLPVYILDDESAGNWKMGSAARVWLHHSLKALSASLDGRLAVYRGRAGEILSELTGELDVEGVYWNRCYEPWCVRRDGAIREMLREKGITARSFNGSLLWEPWQVLKADGSPYRVFSPFYYKGCEAAGPPGEALPRPAKIDAVEVSGGPGIDALDLLPGSPRWDIPMMQSWQPGEPGAQKRLSAFLETGLAGYGNGRDIPSRPQVSRLSPHLQAGEISPNTVWHSAGTAGAGSDLKRFRSELGWREFSSYLLYHFPTLPEQNHQPRFDRFPWTRDDEKLAAWKKGQTGIPIVDAGMRELWQTGYMHNRVRMIAASFLVKNLMIDWREGEKWFWDTLVDADLANNSAGWQWVAGSGADAAPYFRIFNPVIQARKFDGQGEYIRKFVQEIKHLPDRHLHAPWEAPEAVLAGANIRLGDTYPRPIADLAASRAAALEAFRGLGGNT